MNINKLLEGVSCQCGKHHTCDIKYVYIEDNACAHLNKICEEYRNILIVADENTYSAAGEKTERELQGKQIKKVIFSGEKILVPDETAVDTVTAALQGTDLIIGIGSGVIQDLCKYVSFKNKIPYLVVATAPSMDGYCSNGAAMIMGGMKVTYSAGLPLAIVADVDVLKNAPIDMIKAGYGDIIGKFSALNDWKLAHLILGEYFCPYIYDLTKNQIDRTLTLASGILKRQEDAIKVLMEALVVIGILMSFAGSSRPASGSEHHLSHFFEITGILNNREYFPHGIDVAFSTVITAQIREKILADKFPVNICCPDTRNEKIHKIYGKIADSCIALQQKTGYYNTDRAGAYLNNEAEIRSILADMPTSKDIGDMLGLAELNMDDFYNMYSAQTIADAVLYAKDLKDRFTVLWMNYDFYGE